MAARKYELGICSCEQVEHGRYHAGHKPLAVTAIDSRDVEPLAEAAQTLTTALHVVDFARAQQPRDEYLLGQAREKEGEALLDLEATLAPFLDGGENDA